MGSARTISRRALLFGQSATDRAGASPIPGPSPAPPVLRPPWALPGGAFTAACTGCVACVDACPEQVLVLRKGKAVFEPERGECTFCHACVDACAPGALRDREEGAPWAYLAAVGDACLAARGVVCASCRDACPQSAILIPPAARGGARVDAEACSGCGACVAVCPTGAIHLHLPQESVA
nr:ferredoxin-type protein NapF [Pseudoxanthomonas sp.]